MKQASILILGCLVLMNCCCRDAGENASAVDAAKRDRLTVLTYNLWHGLNPEGLVRFEQYETPAQREARLQCFYRYVRELNPDILFLQEVNPAPGMSKRLAHELDYDVTFAIDNAGIKIGSVGLPTNLRSGQAILAKKDLQLKGLGKRKLSGPFGWTGRCCSFQLEEFRDAVAARVVINGRPVLLMGVHLHHGPEADRDIRGAVGKMVREGNIVQARGEEIIATFNLASARRRLELNRALAWARNLAGENEPMLLAGDFNASPDAPELQWLKQEEDFASVTADEDPADLLLTWNYQRNPNTHFFADFVPVNEFEPQVMEALNSIVVTQTKRLDYIFHRRLEGWKVREAGLFAEEVQEGIACSDHFGIYTVFEVD